MIDGTPAVLKVESWRGIDGLVHAFIGRSGGVSEGDCASLNVSERVGDDLEAVAENWRTVRRLFPGLGIVRMEQVHGTRVARVSSASQNLGAADAAMTNRAGIGLAVLTADCVPILVACPGARIAMAVHAGWRGTVAGVGRAAVRSVRLAYGVTAEELRVALGPAIGACCYEVDAEIGERLESRWGEMPEAWSRLGSKGQLDLRSANRTILGHAGVPPENIVEVGPCTACAHDHFFSHRRSRGRTGRQVSVIGWTAGEP